MLEVDIDYQVDVKEVYGFWIKFLELYIEVKQYYYVVGSCINGNYYVIGNGFV